MQRLGRGLPGYLIRFAPHAFAPQRHNLSSKLPSLSVFLPVSTHSTATLVILLTSPGVKRSSIQRLYRVKPCILTSDLLRRLRALYAQ